VEQRIGLALQHLLYVYHYLSLRGVGWIPSVQYFLSFDLRNLSFGGGKETELLYKSRIAWDTSFIDHLLYFANGYPLCLIRLRLKCSQVAYSWDEMGISWVAPKSLLTLAAIKPAGGLGDISKYDYHRKLELSAGNIIIVIFNLLS
jgi:hypothetical protein